MATFLHFQKLFGAPEPTVASKDDLIMSQPQVDAKQEKGGHLVNTALQQLMERNVLEVFGERDSERRKSVINELYTEDCNFSDFETDDRSVGREALNAKVEHLLEGTPGFVFRLAGPAQVIQDLGRVQWHYGPNGAAPVVIGTDVAVFKHGRIFSLYAFIDKAPGD